ncbi:SMC-Scp complex subunit ScpB [Alkanindiges sp. WGS2144]|uniref:SMC-Scp complex subunit ScpB n=1 Tax=Alkanindiges sp. WGS2144 TaxID=3366808 RepID=UPI0037511F2E
MLPDMPHPPTNLSEAALLRLEAIIFASEGPVSLSTLKQSFDDEVSTTKVKQWLETLAARQNDRAVELVETAQGYRFQVREQYSGLIAQLWPERPLRLSSALLETLAVIAYHQPVTRADIEQIRGVSVNSQILRTLFDRQWITESGFREVAGRPALLVTTKQFLNAFGLVSLKALPPLEDVREVLTAFEDSLLSAQQTDAPA